LAALIVAVLVVAGVAVLGGTASQAAAPESIFGTATPTVLADPDTVKVELGVRFKAAVAGQVTGVRFYKSAANTGTHTGSLWTGSTRTRTGTFTGETASGWQTLTFATPVNITAGTTYTASYLAPRGRYSVDDPYTFPKTTGNLTAIKGTYRYGGGYPTLVFQKSNYWVDVTFVPASTPTTTPPVSTTPVSTTPPVTTTPVVTTTTAPLPLGCAAVPSSCGYPDATNTGVPPGTTLVRVPQDATSGPGWTWDTRFGGFMTTTTAGAVIDGYDVTGPIDVTHNNVTIKRSKFTYTGQGNVINLKHTTGSTVDQVTITTPPGTTGADRLQVGIKDVYGDNHDTTITRSDISGWCNGIQTHEGVIRDNYVHDPIYGPGDHTNAFTSNESQTPLLIQHNTMFNSEYQTDAISLFQDFGIQAYATVDNNLLAGGGYTVYAGGGGYGISHDIRFTNNRFARIYFPNSGSYGPVTAWDDGGTNNVWSGNVWDDTGLPVSV
jgi:hypothetical protein